MRLRRRQKGCHVSNHGWVRATRQWKNPRHNAKKGRKVKKTCAGLGQNVLSSKGKFPRHVAPSASAGATEEKVNIFQ
ncbi:hypothetical protein KI387_023642, partial [Taxus chinensis]